MTEKKPAEGLTRLRQEKKLSLKALAERIDVTPATVWQWEQDEGKIKQKQLKQLSTVFSEDELRQAFPDKYPGFQFQGDPFSHFNYSSMIVTQHADQQQHLQPQRQKIDRLLTPEDEDRLQLLDDLFRIIPELSTSQLRVLIQAVRAINVDG